MQSEWTRPEATAPPPRPHSPLISPNTVSQVNRARVLQALYDVGPLSRADLARLTEVSRATIGSIVQPMIDSEMLAEGDPQPSSAAGGKPSRPLWFSPNSPPIAAVHLLPGHVETALVSAGGTILTTASREYPADTRDADLVVDAVADALDELFAPNRPAALGVGIAVGGMVNTDSGTIVQVNLAPGLAGLPIGPLIADRTGLPVYVDLHPRVQALGDRWFGQGRGLSTFASLYAGEALGVGLVLNGSVHRGPGGAGGEIGHSIVQVDGLPCRCGQRGCWETIATHRWLRDEAARLNLPSASTLTVGPLTRLAAKGHPGAAQLFDRYVDNLAVGITNIQQLLAPGLFILHGDVVAGGEALRGKIEWRVRQRTAAHPGSQPQIAFSALHDDSTLLGAAGLVLSHFLQLTP
ncbi:ROK family protein [Streptosporangium saharense]|uniref:Putative NBD/HSP70 family sugar kinase n=1 Tax=Streptosporangium saharense TaxID=1706840 RepID=A0A7W7QJP8_9ACTN|nr:ROK family protein [Streptosporangium saharense]MBB4914799.1 putative NBD/HSP70 family sugar kinase [Streptosporangium saharense]